MIVSRSTRGHRLRRLVLVAVAALLLVGTAYGPSNVAAALGLREGPLPPAPPLGFVPSPFPIVLDAPTARLAGLEKVEVHHVIPLSDGSFSPPDSVYLRFKQVELDQLVIKQPRPGEFDFAITNTGSGPTAAVVGNPDAVTELVAVVHSLDICVTANTLQAVAIGYAGVFGGALDNLLRLIADIFAPVVASALGPVGPCIPLTALLPALAVFVDYGVPLPAVLPVANLNANVYAVKVATAPGTPSVTLPLGMLQVSQ